MKKNILQFSALVLILLGFNSCATTKLLPDNVSNNAKNLATQNEKGLVYVYRISSLGFAVGLMVDCNTVELASLYPKKYYLCALDPGKYIFTGHGENEDEVILNVEPNKKYYIEVTPQMGWIQARCKLTQIAPAEGVAKIQKCALVGLNKDAQILLNYSPQK